MYTWIYHIMYPFLSVYIVQRLNIYIPNKVDRVRGAHDSLAAPTIVGNNYFFVMRAICPNITAAVDAGFM